MRHHQQWGTFKLKPFYEELSNEEQDYEELSIKETTKTKPFKIWGIFKRGTFILETLKRLNFTEADTYNLIHIGTYVYNFFISVKADHILQYKNTLRT